MNPQEETTGSTPDQQRIAELENRVVELTDQLRDVTHRFDSLLDWSWAVASPESRGKFGLLRPRRFWPQPTLPQQAHPFREGS